MNKIIKIISKLNNIILELTVILNQSWVFLMLKKPVFDMTVSKNL